MAYKFKNKQYDKIWKMHPSYQKSVYFQRLEFYGDKILSFVITSYLFQNQHLNEGDLSVFLSSLINKDTIAEVGRDLKKYIVCTGSLTNAMICDCIEVYIACVYMDGGDVFELISEMWGDRIYQTFEPSSKNQLQEILQERGLFPTYDYIQEDGLFKCSIIIDDKEYDRYTITGVGKSKKQASANAAKKLIEKLIK